MRIFLFLVVALCAAVAGGSGAAAPSSPGARDVSYLFHAQFDIDYSVDWVETTGNPLDQCAIFTDDRGSSQVSAGSLTWIPGQLTILGKANPKLGKWAWAVLSATGARKQGRKVPMNARVEITRQLVQRGGPAPGCVTPPPPFVTPPNDCGTRVYTTQKALLLADASAWDRSPELWELLQPGNIPVIRVTVPPTHGKPYRICKTTLNAPPWPTGFPVRLLKSDIAALRTLKEGEKHSISRTVAGLCIHDLPDTTSCHFDLNITVTIRRWTHGTLFP